MRFTKMHGTGNDFVIMDVRATSIDQPTPLARAICDRRRGVGADGLILIAHAEQAAARMHIYNADGSRAQMCGNGLRCVAKYLFDRRFATGASFAIETDDGVKTAKCDIEADKVVRVRIDVGKPRFEMTDSEVLPDGGEMIDREIDVGPRPWTMTCVSMGNPHAVMFVDSLDSVALQVHGPAIEHHVLFPQRINVHFVQVLDDANAKVLTWERGSGATQACGTGMSAVCAAGARTGRTRRRLTTFVPGGRLDLEWTADDHMFLTGDAVEVFTGEWCPAN